MYCYIKYITHIEFLILEENESVESQLKENRLLIVNPDCMVGVLMEYIFNEAKINRKIRRDFDLCTEKGKGKDVKECLVRQSILAHPCLVSDLGGYWYRRTK
ncbi:unnamed protein product [Acanthoscelides obtectus]|uniref:Uncharacterized protein n=1 Tax=Acanthoscelides obtectus TaxID=200917 RepID=A0A9P0Q2F3_ACAOB|nr:unnamed protein product [Acanthoscelides obtectus]CAK1654785.1 hypothetical protein AOBTE_LOCUS18840 [Acanthoscelides obtectus]